LFTNDFRKLRLVAITLAAAASIYGSIAICLDRIAERSESDGAYPYLAGEESMRLLLPSIVGHRADLMLTGPSDAADGFVVADFEAAFPGARIVSMPISAATLDDILILLQYLEKVYGAQAAPRVLVVGISARVVANIPRRFGRLKDPAAYAPLIHTINRYSPYMSVDSTATGSQLVPKSAAASALARLRFLRKQQPRYRTGVVDAIRRMVAHDGTASRSPDLPALSDIRRPFNVEDLEPTLAYLKHASMSSFLRDWLTAYESPYLYRYMAPLAEPEIRRMVANKYIYTRVHAWKPLQEESLVRAQLQQLTGRCAALGIRLYVVNLPEHRLSRQRYVPGCYDSYLRLVTESLGTVPFLNLHELLDDDEFYDGYHPSARGAQRVTESVVSLLRSHLQAHLPPVTRSAAAHERPCDPD
jgi:hypothetical protein